MELNALEQLLGENHVAVVTTFRRDGRPQMSLVTVGSFEGGLAFTTQQGRAKAANLKRDPRCAIMLTKPNWRGYGVLDGDAEVRGSHNTDAEMLRIDLRAVYRVAAGQEHPDWEAYDRAMVEQRRVVVVLKHGRLVTVNAG